MYYEGGDGSYRLTFFDKECINFLKLNARLLFNEPCLDWVERAESLRNLGFGQQLITNYARIMSCNGYSRVYLFRPYDYYLPIYLGMGAKPLSICDSWNLHYLDLRPE
jgi:hypothetical protein